MRKNPPSLNAENMKNMNKIMYCIRKMPVYYLYFYYIKAIIFVNYFASERFSFDSSGYKGDIIIKGLVSI